MIAVSWNALRGGYVWYCPECGREGRDAFASAVHARENAESHWVEVHDRRPDRGRGEAAPARERPVGVPTAWPATCARNGALRPACPAGKCEQCDLEQDRAIGLVKGAAKELRR